MSFRFLVELGSFKSEPRLSQIPKGYNVVGDRLDVSFRFSRGKFNVGPRSNSCTHGDDDPEDYLVTPSVTDFLC